jgi:starch synthase
MMRKVLFASSEVFPLVKTGGLADVAGSLPGAMCALRQDVRIILPAYTEVLDSVERTRCMARLDMPQGEVRILMGDLPGSSVKVWLVDYPPFFARTGNPYMGPDDKPWPDNAERFHLFCRVIVEIAMKRTRLKWKPDIIHCNDWQTGLVPVLLSQEEKQAPPTVFTIHNMAYQGLFPHSSFVALGLHDSLWSHDALEFHGQLSFIKGGLVYADRITTVSPTYAKEIQTPEFGYGLEGLLSHRSDYLTGILNGIDTDIWNTETDPYITEPYSVRHVEYKQLNKKALQQRFNLPKSNVPLAGFIGRLVYQKGIDIILQAIDKLMQLPLQLVFLGSGEQKYQQLLLHYAEQYPNRIAVSIGYDEALAHQIEAGADLFLMPSRFEPCGLNQMYSLHYGTLPVVRNVGGLADTVVNSSPTALASGDANGFVFSGEQPRDLVQTMTYALQLYKDELSWKRLQITGMWRDFSWDHSAREYVQLYDQID